MYIVILFGNLFYIGQKDGIVYGEVNKILSILGSLVGRPYTETFLSVEVRSRLGEKTRFIGGGKTRNIGKGRNGSSHLLLFVRRGTGVQVRGRRGEPFGGEILTVSHETRVLQTRPVSGTSIRVLQLCQERSGGL